MTRSTLGAAVTVVVFVFILGAALPASASEAPAPGERPVISTEQLPHQTAVTNGEKPLYLSISPPPIVAIGDVTDSANAGLTVTFEERTEEKTMVSLSKSKALPALKVDLYMSPDGERWHYTSSCPISVTTYEMWPHHIAYLAVANVRQVDASTEGLCN